MRSQLLTTLALASSVASAHFVLHWPPNLGFDEETQPTSPCGGFTFSTPSTNLTVSRFQVLIQNVHPVGEWSFRGSISTSPPYDFSELVPVIETSAVSDFCLEYLTAPEEWVGKEGILQIVDNSPDGVLYQCAAVTWTAGANDTLGAGCTNSSSSFAATWTNREGFTGEVSGEHEDGNDHELGEESSSTSTGAAAMATGVGKLVVGGLGVLAMGLAL